MAVEQILAPPPVETPAPAAPPPAPAPEMVTREEAEALANARAAGVRRELEAKMSRQAPAAPPPAPARPAPAADALADLRASMQAQVTFETGLARIAERNRWSPEVEGKVRTLYAAEAPDAGTIPTWLADTAKLFAAAPALAAPSAAPTGATVMATNQIPGVPSPISPAAPSTAVPLERDVSVLEMSAEQIHDRMRRNGADPALGPYHPRNRAARREIRRATESALASRRVGVGDRR